MRGEHDAGSSDAERWRPCWSAHAPRPISRAAAGQPRSAMPPMRVVALGDLTRKMLSVTTKIANAGAIHRHTPAVGPAGDGDGHDDQHEQPEITDGIGEVGRRRQPAFRSCCPARRRTPRPRRAPDAETTDQCVEPGTRGDRSRPCSQQAVDRGVRREVEGQPEDVRARRVRNGVPHRQHVGVVEVRRLPTCSNAAANDHQANRSSRDSDPSPRTRPPLRRTRPERRTVAATSAEPGGRGGRGRRSPGGPAWRPPPSANHPVQAGSSPTPRARWKRVTSSFRELDQGAAYVFTALNVSRSM